MWEKRRWKRVKVGGAVCLLSLNVETDTKLIRGVKLNLSTGGIRILIKDFLPVGTKVELKFSLYQNKQIIPLNIKGCIMWNKEYTIKNEKCYVMGIEFVKISKEDINILTDFVIAQLHKDETDSWYSI